MESKKEKEEDESFEKQYMKYYTKDHIRTLQSPGTWLNDSDVFNLFFLLAWKKGYNPKQMRIIDPLYITTLNSGSDVSNLTMEYNKRLFTRNLTPLLFLPLYHNDHWSLLYYRKATGKWFLMDSLHPYHATYARRLLLLLEREGYLTVAKRSEVHYFSALPRQPKGWECGLYLLLYMLIVADSLNDREIASKLYLADDQHRRHITEFLLELLEDV